MSTGRNVETMLTPTEKELLTNTLRVQPACSAVRLWERCLSQRDRACLGNDLESAYRRHGTAGMWARLRGVTRQRAVVDVAQKLGFLRDEDHEWLLREIGEPLDVDEAISRAIAPGVFVLVEHPREAYWNGERIDIDWDRCDALWVFVWKLGRRGKAGRAVDAFCFGENAGRDVVTKRKSRLKGTRGVPADLVELIRVAGRGTQRLMLRPEQIRIFALSGIDMLSEWYP